tara:strand:+ start:2407 stop:3393 length:987 start_codon:yes stop_codon:yes gene_type:complete
VPCYDSSGVEVSCAASNCEFGDCSGGTIVEESPQGGTVDDFLNTSLADAVSPFLDDPESAPQWLDEYGMYFQSYDASKEGYIRNIAGLREKSVVQGAIQDKQTLDTIEGASGFSSSYQPTFGAESIANVTSSSMSEIRQAKGQSIYEARKDHMEEFYDTIKDLAALDVFGPLPETVESDGVGDWNPDYDAIDDVDDDIMNQANCEAIGGTFNLITGACNIDPGFDQGGCPDGYIELYGDCVPEAGGGVTPGLGTSDARLKENILQIGSRDGINLYEFEYIDKKWGEGRYRGVMAQDLLQTSYRNAVHLNDDGYMLVDYSKLPVDMEKV